MSAEIPFSHDAQDSEPSSLTNDERFVLEAARYATAEHREHIAPGENIWNQEIFTKARATWLATEIVVNNATTTVQETITAIRSSDYHKKMLASKTPRDKNLHVTIADDAKLFGHMLYDVSCTLPEEWYMDNPGWQRKPRILLHDEKGALIKERLMLLGQAQGLNVAYLSEDQKEFFYRANVYNTINEISVGGMPGPQIGFALVETLDSTIPFAGRYIEGTIQKWVGRNIKGQETGIGKFGLAKYYANGELKPTISKIKIDKPTYPKTYSQWFKEQILSDVTTEEARLIAVDAAGWAKNIGKRSNTSSTGQFWLQRSLIKNDPQG